MGNITPTITDILHMEEANLARFRRALRREDQIALDGLFIAAYKHRAAAAYAGHLLPFETFLLGNQLEVNKEIIKLRADVERLLKIIEKLSVSND